MQTLNNLNAVTVKRYWKLVSSELKLHKKSVMHTIKNSRKIIISLCYVWLSVYKHLFYQIVESNRKNRFVSVNGPGLADTKMSPFWILFELGMIDVVATTGAIRCAVSSQIVTTNKPTPSFTQAECPSSRPTNHQPICLSLLICGQFWGVSTSHTHARTYTHTHTWLEDATLDDTVDVDRQQLHALGQNQLSRWRRRRAVLTIARQQLCTLGRQVLTHLTRVWVQAVTDCCKYTITNTSIKARVSTNCC